MMTYIHPDKIFLILMLFTFMIFPLIYLTFTDKEVPTLILFLSQFPPFFIFEIVPTSKLLFDLVYQSLTQDE